jgi:hypothetical protein
MEQTTRESLALRCLQMNSRLQLDIALDKNDGDDDDDNGK